MRNEMQNQYLIEKIELYHKHEKIVFLLIASEADKVSGGFEGRYSRNFVFF